MKLINKRFIISIEGKGYSKSEKYKLVKSSGILSRNKISIFGIFNPSEYDLTEENLTNFYLIEKDGELLEKPKIEIELSERCGREYHFETPEEVNKIIEQFKDSNKQFITIDGNLRK